MDLIYDIIVVGGGHSGCEAAAAAANLGSKALLITMDMTQMSCNPAVGGIAKGQIVREIDALGGYMGVVTDKSTIQFRMLNKSKGPAMWSPRAQCDRVKFTLSWREVLEDIQNLDLWQDVVKELIIEKSAIKGVKTGLGISFYAKSVILTNGTFINGLIHVGRNKTVGGRISEPPSTGISEQLKQHGFFVGRMKTGTPARLDGRTIDFSVMSEQKGDENPGRFSFFINNFALLKQKSCFITYTNTGVHDILKTGFDDSPLFTGVIQGIGPRYCPSIEVKIETFSSKDSHQLFIEPEGENTNEYYINGFSSSLPWDVQYKALRRIKGLENVKIYRPGYAIEYDYFPPTQLRHTLETKLINGLYFAGQINGTTGYEEAAAQGIMAAINAHQKNNGNEPLVLNRDQAYIGVLIDDLVTKGVDEPYRMFTSRSEYRILLRQDNADSRLTPVGYKIGLVKEDNYSLFQKKQNEIDRIINLLKIIKVKPEYINNYFTSINTTPLRQKTTVYDILLRPQVNIKGLVDAFPKLKSEVKNLDENILDSVEILIKYSGYIERESLIASKILRLEYMRIPDNIDYNSFNSITIEARQKLNNIKPQTIGQASRISGVSPSDINVLLIHFKR